MWTWLAPLIGVLIALFAVAVIVGDRRKKKKGKSSCCSDCGCCPHCSACKGQDDELKKLEEIRNKDQ